MNYLAHMMREDPGCLERRDVLRHHALVNLGWLKEEGTLLIDAPAANNKDQLVWMAGGSGTEEDRKLNRLRWAGWAKELLCPADRQRLKRREKKTEPKEKIPALTAEQTQAVLRSTPHKYRIYTDGGCTGNGQKGVWGTAAFGVHVMEVISAADDRWIIENQVEPGEEGEEKALCEVCSAPVRYCVCSTDRAPAEVAPPHGDEPADRLAVAIAVGASSYRRRVEMVAEVPQGHEQHWRALWRDAGAALDAARSAG